ncbi:MAG TPA: urease accessory protein UreD [Pyrinomonadaceae bacterium]|nr:urease accessory protein UreD [Pyrinomonadaceae bacterium]
MRNEAVGAALQPAHVGSAPPHVPPTHGRLSLRFECAPDVSAEECARGAGETCLVVLEQRPPLRVVRAFRTEDGAALVHLHNLSGGVLGGDLLELSVEVCAGARAQLTSTGATRLYRSRRGASAAVQRQRFEVGEGALLEYLPDELIPFACARYRQETTVELADDAGLFWWEMVAPGRAARGEVFAYDSLQFRLDLTARGLPVAQERVALDPERRPLQSAARLGPYLYFANFYVCRVGLPERRWVDLEESLAALAQELSRTSEIIWGVSALPRHGLVVRALAVKGRDVTQGLHAFWRAAKRELYGRAAVPPRKIY